MASSKDVSKAASMGSKSTSRTHRTKGGYRAGDKVLPASAKRANYVAPDSTNITTKSSVKNGSGGVSAKRAHKATSARAKRAPRPGSKDKGGSAADSDGRRGTSGASRVGPTGGSGATPLRASGGSGGVSARTGAAARRVENKPKSAPTSSTAESGATSSAAQRGAHSRGAKKSTKKAPIGPRSAKGGPMTPTAAGKNGLSAASTKLKNASGPDVAPVHTRSASGTTPTGGNGTPEGPEDDSQSAVEGTRSDERSTSEQVSWSEQETPQPILQRHRGEAYVPPGWFKPRGSYSSEMEVESGVASSGEGSGSKGAAVSSTASHSFLRRITGAEGKHSARRRLALCTACCVLGACLASVAALFLLHTNDSSWDHSCKTQFCARAQQLMTPARGAPSPCDNFYGHVCFEFERRGVSFLEALRLRRKTDYHEHLLSMSNAAATGDATRKLALAHQVCAQFSHRQNPSLRTMASQMRQSLESEEMTDFLEARSPHNDTVRVLTRAAVRMGIGTLFTVVESAVASDRRLHIVARKPRDYAFGISEKDKLLAHVDTLLRYLWRDKATDFALRAIVGLATRLSKIPFKNEVWDEVENLEDYVPNPGNFMMGRMITDSVPANVHLHQHVSAVIVNSKIIARAYDILEGEERDTANLYLLVLFFDEYLKQVVGTRQTFQESLSCTLLGSKLFPPQYGASEAALFYDQTAARDLRDIFDHAKVTAAEHLGIHVQSVDLNLNILEPGSFRTDREALSGTHVHESHALNIVEGLKVTMTGMLRRVAEGKYGGEARSLVEAQFEGAFDYDARVSSLLVATQNLQPPFYCQNTSVVLLSPRATQGDGSVPVPCEGDPLKPFLNYGLAATATVEAVLAFIIQKRQFKDVEERARCYKEQLDLSSDAPADTLAIVRGAMGLSLALAMLKSQYRSKWRDLELDRENRTALQLLFHRHCLRHCDAPSKGNASAGFLTGEDKCHLALLNMEEFFRAYNCKRSAPMQPRISCPI
ncbi:hypothetical protein V5799_011453 [Amblyomma americanum]|uniref:Uncharacterized protein n=1 Tax=Amblyomma americanum TaxID=6943 RepID=A0AAQ4EH51_AMBAM